MPTITEYFDNNRQYIIDNCNTMEALISNKSNK